MENILSPSILSANFQNLSKDLDILVKNDIKYIHLDVMDGIFVPNISFGIPIIKSLKRYYNFVFDTHLMITYPERYIKEFRDSGADILTIHVESTNHLDRVIDNIKENGMKAGVAINPATNVNVLEDILHKIDMVLFMSVNPGFGGQKFIDHTIDKIKKIKEISDKKNLNIEIEVDGGITKDNIKDVVLAGANIIVAGSSIFNGNIDKNIKELKKFL